MFPHWMIGSYLGLLSIQYVWMLRESKYFSENVMYHWYLKVHFQSVLNPHGPKQAYRKES